MLEALVFLNTASWNSSNKPTRRIKLITRLLVGLCHLRKHMLKRSFQDTLNAICSCSFDAESTSHYILHCPMQNDESIPDHRLHFGFCKIPENVPGGKCHNLPKSFFLHKTNKKMLIKLEMKCVIHLRVWHHLHWIQNF